MAEFIARWFTPSDSDQHGQGDSLPAGQAAHAQPQAAPRPAEVKQQEREAKRPKKRTITKFGGVSNDPAMLSEQADMAKKSLLGQ